jgi:hypothetical protein
MNRWCLAILHRTTTFLEDNHQRQIRHEPGSDLGSPDHEAARDLPLFPCPGHLVGDIAGYRHDAIPKGGGGRPSQRGDFGHGGGNDQYRLPGG